MKLAKNPVFLQNFSKFMGILLFVLKYMYIFLLLKIINGFSWPTKIMASPFNHKISCGLKLARKDPSFRKVVTCECVSTVITCELTFERYYLSKGKLSCKRACRRSVAQTKLHEGYWPICRNHQHLRLQWSHYSSLILLRWTM